MAAPVHAETQWHWVSRGGSKKIILEYVPKYPSQYRACGRIENGYADGYAYWVYLPGLTPEEGIVTSQARYTITKQEAVAQVERACMGIEPAREP
jgi:hypothetical protein